MIHVLAPGLRATIQDRGRRGHAREGVPPAGPADPMAFAAALELAGCAPDAAAIEVVGLPFAFRCDDRRIVAATGRDVGVRTRSRLPGWTSVLVRAGEEVVVEGSAMTRFAYVAISGGVAVPPVLGSRATYLGASLGPIPRALVIGDALPLGPSSASADIAGRHVSPPSYGGPVRAVAGPHDDRFSTGTVAAFFSSLFAVSPDSDRMGVRLSGDVVGGPGADLLSCGIVAGAVQIPRGGAPIVLLADHQTTGGYPIIATVVHADLGIVAQRSPGEYLRFARVTPGRTLRSASR